MTLEILAKLIIMYGMLNIVLTVVGVWLILRTLGHLDE
jgi:hypothetical protein